MANYQWYDDLGYGSVLDGRNWAQVPGAVLDVVNQATEAVTDLGENLNANFTIPNDLTPGQSKYNFNSRVFPSDVGSSFAGHFLVLNINVQNGTMMNNINKAPNLAFTVDNEELSKTDAYRYKIDNTWTANKIPQGKAGGIDGFFTRARFTRRIVESIALYMPNSELTFSDAHDFENISLTKFGGDALTKGLTALGGSAGAVVGGMISSAGDVVGNISQVTLGRPINPKVEVLFANTFQREFAFEFLFSPSNRKEADDLENIIRTIRFHAAPEYSSEFHDAKFYWIPPSEFDITFYYFDVKGHIRENRKIPRINTCALKQVDVSYAPSGAYSTFTDGHPVQIRMVLRFIETEVNSKLRIAQGF
jgi:hypothetical protein